MLARDTHNGGSLKGDKTLPQVPSRLMGVIIGLKRDGFGCLSTNDFLSPLSLLVVDLSDDLENGVLKGFISLYIDKLLGLIINHINRIWGGLAQLHK